MTARQFSPHRRSIHVVDEVPLDVPSIKEAEIGGSGPGSNQATRSRLEDMTRLAKSPALNAREDATTHIESERDWRSQGSITFAFLSTSIVHFENNLEKSMTGNILRPSTFALLSLCLLGSFFYGDLWRKVGIVSWGGSLWGEPETTTSSSQGLYPRTPKHQQNSLFILRTKSEDFTNQIYGNKNIYRGGKQRKGHFPGQTKVLDLHRTLDFLAFHIGRQQTRFAYHCQFQVWWPNWKLGWSWVKVGTTLKQCCPLACLGYSPLR